MVSCQEGDVDNVLVILLPGIGGASIKISLVPSIQVTQAVEIIVICERCLAVTKGTVEHWFSKWFTNEDQHHFEISSDSKVYCSNSKIRKHSTDVLMALRNIWKN